MLIALRVASAARDSAGVKSCYISWERRIGMSGMIYKPLSSTDDRATSAMAFTTSE